MIQKDDLNQVLNRTVGWTENCDTKASIILGGLGVMISVLISRTNIKEISARGVNLDSLVFFESIAKNSTCQMYKEKLTE